MIFNILYIADPNSIGYNKSKISTTVTAASTMSTTISQSSMPITSPTTSSSPSTLLTLSTTASSTVGQQQSQQGELQ
jgi:hypothetical protein